MDEIRELILEDVRCFQGTQRGHLRPITLLVGENSTGKTTFLGCYRILHRVLSKQDVNINEQLDFNEEPFSMGSFHDIVRLRRGPSGRIDEFKLGFTIAPHKDVPPHEPYEISVAFSEKGSQPVISSLRYQFNAESFLALRPDDADGTILSIPYHEARAILPLRFMLNMLDIMPTLEDPALSLSLPPNLQLVVKYLETLFPNRKTSKAGRTRQQGYGFEFLLAGDVIPIAPLRSKPKRTYDPVRETASPEGEHIPMLMMRLDRTDKNHWNSLRDSLLQFGHGSGLFADIKVKRHGKQMSDPFQLQVKVRSGPHANIMDVGYGVSQSLPILVDVLAAESGLRRQGGDERTFLLQQPEIHLHPRGQAALASLLVESFEKRGNRFLIETHSDYIVDRVRISVRKQILKPEDVSILYFEPKRNAVVIHNMTLDKYGNLQDAPEGYRDFFLKETDQLLGFAD